MAVPGLLRVGLIPNPPASPYVQEMAALLVSKVPPEQAVLVTGSLLAQWPVARALSPRQNSLIPT